MDSKKFWSFWFPMGHCCQTLDEFVTEFYVPADFRADKGWDSWSRLKFDQWIVNDVSLTFAWINQKVIGDLAALATRCDRCDLLFPSRSPDSPGRSFPIAWVARRFGRDGRSTAPAKYCEILDRIGRAWFNMIQPCVLSWSSLAICTSHPPIWIMIPPSDVIS